MELYNINTDKIENIEYIEDDGLKYIDKMSDLQLNFYGYYKTTYGEKPDGRYYTYIENKELKNDLYTITYTPEEKPLVSVQNLMKRDLNEAYKEYADNAEVDTGLGFKVKGTRNDLDNLERAANKNKKEVRDNQGKKQTISVPQMKQIAEDVEDQAFALSDTNWFKFDEIEGFTTVDECIYYEATPYEEEILDEDGNPTGEFITKYKNNTTDWS